MEWLRYLWAAPWTAVGLMAGLLARATGGTLAWRNGIIESSGGLWGWLFPRIGPGAGIAAISGGNAWTGAAIGGVAGGVAGNIRGANQQ